MKRFYSFVAFITLVISFSSGMLAQTLIDQWGTTPQGRYFTIQNDSSTPAGDGSIAGTAPINGAGQASIRGGFDEPMQITMDTAVVVTGELELVGTIGAESSYNPLRFAITYNVDDTLLYPLTDSARWVRSPSYGYIWCPRTGAGTVANGAWGSGTVGIVNGGNWHSTNSNNGPALATILQAPRNAQMVPGVYDWAISVQQINDTTNEIRWYLIEKETKYWFGGTVTGAAVTDTLTGINFNVNTGDWTEVKVIGAEVGYGDPITVPEAPWQKYYIDQWGLTADAYGAGWPILNDETTLVGDASIGGYRPMDAGSNGASVRGGFGQDVAIPADKAVIVTGQMEFVGGDPGSVYTALRYAITYQDSATLQYQYTDSAQWVRNSTNQSAHYGYEITPRSGTADYPNGGGGSGPVWTVINGAWASTYSNGGAPYGPQIQQKPRNAPMIAGTYDWAISVHQVNDTTHEVRWYIVEENKAYWFGGIVQVPIVTDKFNNIAFWTKEGEHTQFNIIEAEIDLGDPIVIPKFLEIAIDGQKDEFYTTLTDPGDGYLQLQWFHGNNNGFAVDNTDLSAKVWTAWDEEWFYMYAEVKDDTISATTTNSYQNDGLELKIDPQPTDSTQGGTSVFAPNLTILGTMGNDTLNAIAADSKEFVRTVVDSGYVLELAIKWTAITTGGETITPDVGNVFGMAINFHDNDGSTTNPRQASIMWAAVMLDQVWNTPKYMGSVYFLDDNKLEWDPTNSMTGVENELPYDGTVVGVELANSQIPVAFSLSQNYPNPFNPSTTIEFALPQNSDVNLVVYDLLGRQVTELVKGNFNAGYHKVRFNASNLASGVYFYSIKAGDFVSVKKLMLLK